MMKTCCTLLLVGVLVATIAAVPESNSIGISRTLQGKKRLKKRKRGKKKKGGNKMMKGKLNACISPVGGEDENNNDVEGKIKIFFYGMDMYVKYDLKNIQSNLTESNPGQIYIDESMSCNETDAIRPRWNSNNITTNPWDEDANVTETDRKNKARGWFKTNNGYYWGQNQGHTIFYRSPFDMNATIDVGCGVLTTEKIKRCNKKRN